jgi:hypothetical protein
MRVTWRKPWRLLDDLNKVKQFSYASVATVLIESRALAGSYNELKQTPEIFALSVYST